MERTWLRGAANENRGETRKHERDVCPPQNAMAAISFSKGEKCCPDSYREKRYEYVNP